MQSSELPAAPRGRRAETQAHVVSIVLRKSFRVAPQKKVFERSGVAAGIQYTCIHSDYSGVQERPLRISASP